MKCDECPYEKIESDCFIKCDFKTEKLKKVKKPKKIPKVSEKRQKEDKIYNKLRIEFLSKKENQLCPITKQKTTEIHHIRKRRGYADNWARDNKISLYLDTRFWLAVSHDGHKKIEDNPNWAIENGYSMRSNQKI